MKSIMAPMPLLYDPESQKIKLLRGGVDILT